MMDGSNTDLGDAKSSPLRVIALRCLTAATSYVIHSPLPNYLLATMAALPPR